MLPFKVYLFSEQGGQVPLKMGGPGDPSSQNTSITAFSEFCIWNGFKALVNMVQPHRLFLPGLDHYSNFINIHKDTSIPKQQEAV